MGNRWLAETGGTRGGRYDERFGDLAASGTDVHGEVDLVAALLPLDLGGGRARVLDAGCGTGRVAVELARRGYQVTGVDLDASMLAVARRRAPSLDWRLGDLATLVLGGAPYDLAVLAGNVVIFTTPGEEGELLAGVARHLAPGGLLLAGFALEPGRLGLAGYDDLADAAGLVLEQRWPTWDRGAAESSDYAVSLHRKVADVRSGA